MVLAPFSVRCCFAIFRVCPVSDMSSTRSMFWLFMGVFRGCLSVGWVFVCAMVV